MILKFTKAVKIGVLLLVLTPTLEITIHSQVFGGGGLGRGQGRREGGIVLPTPPFNPDAGILSKRNESGRTSPNATARRSIKDRHNAAHRNRHRRQRRAPRTLRGRRTMHRR